MAASNESRSMLASPLHQRQQRHKSVVPESMLGTILAVRSKGDARKIMHGTAEEGTKSRIHKLWDRVS
jgi:hypothetical protein